MGAMSIPVHARVRAVPNFLVCLHAAHSVMEEQDAASAPSNVPPIEKSVPRANELFRPVNIALVELYWDIGEHVSRYIAAAEWRGRVVDRWPHASLAFIPSEALRSQTNSACGGSRSLC
jgi:hypothetical protein